MAVPKYKTSKAKKSGRRKVNMRLSAPVLASCANCGNTVTRHCVCHKCGFYRGHQVIEPKT
jgi:large subunit ribosomal protein L32